MTIEPGTRLRTAICCAIIAVGGFFSLRAQPAAAQSVADFRASFIAGYVRAAVRRGRPPDQARREGTCVYDVMAARMTLGQFNELVREHRESLPPEALAPLMPEIRARCFAGAGPAPGESAGAADEAASDAVAQQLRRLRVEAETNQRLSQRHPIPLATGMCTAVVAVGANRLPAGQFPVQCTDPGLQDLMREAVIAAAPFQTPAGSTITVRVEAMDPEPGADSPSAGGWRPTPAVAAEASLDMADSMAVIRQVIQMRSLQAQRRIAAGMAPGRPLVGECSATIHVSEAGLPSDGYVVNCSDPRLQGAMRQAIAAAGAFRARPDSTVLLRVNALFPAL